MAPKLVYFNGKGRGEPLRLLAAATGFDFEDVRMQKEEVPEWKKKAPWGFPILQLDDGRFFCQSQGIRKYIESQDKDKVATPTDPLQAIAQDEVIYSLEDLFAALTPSFFMADDKDKQKAREPIVEKKLLPLLAWVNDRINEDGFIGGNKVCSAEIGIAELSLTLESGQVDYLPTDTPKKYPKIQKLRENVSAVPGIKKWRTDRKQVLV